LVGGCSAQAGSRVPVLIPIFYDVLLGVAFLYYWPTLLAAVSRNAPPSVRATMMGAVFLSSFISDFALGWLGGLYDTMSPAAFWAMHAGIAAVGGLLSFALRRPLKALLGA
jgi:POT family proton-dependent oligopeptide transporter